MPAEVSLTQALYKVRVTATLLVKHYIMTHGHNFDINIPALGKDLGLRPRSNFPRAGYKCLIYCES